VVNPSNFQDYFGETARMKAVQAKRMIPKMIDCRISLGSTEPPFPIIPVEIAFLLKMIYEEEDPFQVKFVKAATN